MGRITGACPVCGHSSWEITGLRCRHCGTGVEGKLSLSRLASLPAEHQDFIEVFVRCRGNIKDVERALGVSYPTVRARLDRAIRALGYPAGDMETRRRQILDALERGEMSAEQAVEALEELR